MGNHTLSRCRLWTALGAAAVWCVVWGCYDAAGGQPAAGLRIAKDETTVSILAAGQPLLRYRYTGVPYKPYVKEFFTPGGINALRDAPHDHLHHHALMFALAVDGVDFWSESSKSKQGRQVHRSLDTRTGSLPGGVSTAGLTQRTDWLSPDGEHLLSELRTVEAYGGRDLRASLLSWRTRLEPGAGKDSLELGGSHYFGLGMRFVQSMDKDGRLFNADGKEGEVIRGEERLVRSRWCAYTARTGGKPVTAAIFDHPHNRRHPAFMFTMPRPFAYLSATLNLWKQPITLKAHRPLELRYGVALWDGRVEAAAVERLYRRWTGLSSAAAGQPAK